MVGYEVTTCGTAFHDAVSDEAVVVAIEGLAWLYFIFVREPSVSSEKTPKLDMLSTSHISYISMLALTVEPMVRPSLVTYLMSEASESSMLAA